METVEFKIEQFKELSRVEQAVLIERSINVLNNKGQVKIDKKIYDNLPDFIYWLIDNL